MNGSKIVPWYSFAALLFIGVLLAGYWFATKRPSIEDLDSIQFPVDVSYMCAEDKALVAIYREGSVSLKLSDGRDLALPQVIAASGIRYANEDESFVFWSKGESAFIEENGAMTYAECAEAPLPI